MLRRVDIEKKERKLGCSQKAGMIARRKGHNHNGMLAAVVVVGDDSNGERGIRDAHARHRSLRGRHTVSYAGACESRHSAGEIERVCAFVCLYENLCQCELCRRPPETQHPLSRFPHTVHPVKRNSTQKRPPYTRFSSSHTPTIPAHKPLQSPFPLPTSLY